MNIQSMEYLIALSKLLNFSKAAAAMYTTQPAFSRVISAAEDELGVALFERSRRHVSLTTAGREIIPNLEKSLELYNQGIQKAKAVSRHSGGKLVVGYIPDTANHDICRLVESFSPAFSDVTVLLRETRYYELQSKILDGELDIAIYTSMQTSFTPKLEYYALFTTPLCAIVHESHPLSARESISPEELREEPLIVLEHDTALSGAWSFVHRFAAFHGFSPWITEQTSILSSSLLQVSCNKGVCIASQFAGHLAPDNVRIIPVEGNESCVRYALWSREKSNPSLAGFIRCIKEQFPQAD